MGITDTVELNSKVEVNSKGEIYHYLLIALIPALAVFMYLSLDMPTVGAKGTWALSVQRAAVLSEADMISIESLARQTVNDLAGSIVDDAFVQDYGCGKFKGKTVINSETGFCIISASQKFSEMASSELSRDLDGEFDIVVEDGKVIGRAKEAKTISSQEVVPTRDSEAAGAGEVYTIRPFKMRYEYVPSFVIAVPQFLEIERRAEIARRAVAECRDMEDLSRCEIDGHRICSADVERGRRLGIVCTDNELLVGVDLTPQRALPVEEFRLVQAVTNSGGLGIEVKVPVDGLSDGYGIYHTNSPGVAERVASVLEPEALFGSISSTFGEFYGRAEVSTLALAECELNRESERGYICGRELVYIIDDERMVDGEEYYVAVSTVKGGDESAILFVVPIRFDGEQTRENVVVQ